MNKLLKDEKALLKDSPLPLYYQLKELLKSHIELGILKPGDCVPSERELVETYEISRPTVRQAINELVVEGLLTREKGRGTFVSVPKIKQWFLESLSSFFGRNAEEGSCLFYQALIAWADSWYFHLAKHIRSSRQPVL